MAVRSGLRTVLVRTLATGVLAAACAAPVAAGTAEAAEREVVSVLGAVTPAPPAGSLVTVMADGALAAVNSTDVPLVLAAPDGRDVVRVSARGVEVDAAHPFTFESRNPPDVPTRLPDGVALGAPPRWTVVSQDVSWRWYDPRTRPDAVRAPGGGRPGSSEVVATWSVPIRVGGAALDVSGRLELRRPAGWFRVEPDPAPEGLSMTVAQGPRPSVILSVPETGPVSIAGLDGEPFLRRTAGGAWEADLASRTYRLNLLGSGSPVPAGEGWRPYAAPGPVSWTDARLVPRPDDDTPARWAVPVLLGDREVRLTGGVRHVPQPGESTGPGTDGVQAAALAAVIVLLGATAGALALRNRRLHTERGLVSSRPSSSRPPGANAP
ncbi:hypothetical protein AD006_30845 (plasmid) [Pseudonocardia sp. EC080610-09]|nr:hypothetical protein AD006_30845 [Pseudonocardia sp. EC080610-09]